MVISKKVSLELAKEIFVNLTSTWLAVILVTPGFFGISSFSQYLNLLLINLPFVILGLFISYWLIANSK